MSGVVFDTGALIILAHRLHQVVLTSDPADITRLALSVTTRTV